MHVLLSLHLLQKKEHARKPIVLTKSFWKPVLFKNGVQRFKKPAELSAIIICLYSHWRQPAQIVMLQHKGRQPLPKRASSVKSQIIQLWDEEEFLGTV